MTIAASQLPASFGENIEADAKLLWPTWRVDVEYATDDHMYWSADLSRLCGYPCAPEGELDEVITCGSKGCSSGEKAGEMLHKDIKNTVLHKYDADQSRGPRMCIAKRRTLKQFVSGSTVTGNINFDSSSQSAQHRRPDDATRCAEMDSRARKDRRKSGRDN